MKKKNLIKKNKKCKLNKEIRSIIFYIKIQFNNKQLFILH